MPLELRIREGDGEERTQVLPGEVAFIGRREDNDVVLPFSFVSARHGRILLREGVVCVEDMGSTNGTLVNGEPLDPMVPRALVPEDRVEIDRIVLRVRFVPRVEDAAEPTYLEMPVPAVLRTPIPPAAAVALPRAAVAPARPSPFAATRGPEASGEMDLEAAVRQHAPSGIASLPPPRSPAIEAPILARRPMPPAEEEADPFRFWALVFRAVGVVAILAALALLVVVLLA